MNEIIRDSLASELWHLGQTMAEKIKILLEKGMLVKKKELHIRSRVTDFKFGKGSKVIQLPTNNMKKKYGNLLIYSR